MHAFLNRIFRLSTKITTFSNFPLTELPINRSFFECTLPRQNDHPPWKAHTTGRRYVGTEISAPVTEPLFRW